MWFQILYWVLEPLFQHKKTITPLSIGVHLALASSLKTLNYSIKICTCSWYVSQCSQVKLRQKADDFLVDLHF